MRRGFRYGNKFMLLMWRLGLQRFGMSNPYAGYIMVLTHKGRKSGLARRTPVNFAVINGDVYCVAGFGAVADWYRNLLADPHVQVWLPDGSWWAGEAEDVTDLPDEQRLPLLRQVLINSGFAAYAAGLNPNSMSDAALDAATAGYKLVRIRLAGAAHGRRRPKRPGVGVAAGSDVVGALVAAAEAIVATCQCPGDRRCPGEVAPSAVPGT